MEELEKLKKEHVEATLKLDEADKELTIAKSDCASDSFSDRAGADLWCRCAVNLVNKDQLDVLHSLRESVAVEKSGLESEVARLQSDLTSLRDRTSMQASQIQSLLMQKVDLQADGIDQREKALEQERDMGALRASLKGKGLPEEDQKRFEALQARLEAMEKTEKETEKKLAMAKEFIREQDRLFREAHEGKSVRPVRQAPGLGGSTDGTFGTGSVGAGSTDVRGRDRDAQGRPRAPKGAPFLLVRTSLSLRWIAASVQTAHEELEARYQRELRLMSSAWHHLGQQRIRESVAAGSMGQRQQQPQAWLGQQRQRTMGRSLLVRFA